MADTPSTVVTLGTEPQNVFVKALEDAAAELKSTLTSPGVERAIIAGIFSFLGKEFPVAAPFLAPTENFILGLLHLGTS